MKKRLQRKIIGMIFLVLFLSACAGVQDWTYELPNGFTLERISAKNIAIYTEQGTTMRLAPLVVEFCISGQYVGVNQISPQDYETYQKQLVVEQTIYIIDTEKDEIYGPYMNKIDFNAKVENLKIDGLGEWISVYPRPEGASHGPEGLPPLG